MHYCEFVAALPSGTDNPNKHYHDTQYGFPIEDDNELFERLVLEINQAGLNWTLMLKKRQAFQTAFEGFDINTVAAFDDTDRARESSRGGCTRAAYFRHGKHRHRRTPSYRAAGLCISC